MENEKNCEHKTFYDYEKKYWEQLSESDKAIALMYKTMLISNKDPLKMRGLILKMNNIHEKYEGFSMCCVP